MAKQSLSCPFQATVAVSVLKETSAACLPGERRRVLCMWTVQRAQLGCLPGGTWESGRDALGFVASISNPNPEGKSEERRKPGLATATARPINKAFLGKSSPC